MAQGATKFNQHMDGNEFRPATRITGLTGSATAGSRVTVTHGLGYTPKAVIPVATASAADASLTANVGEIAVVSMDDTAIVVRAAVASAPFDLVVFG